MKKYIVYMHIFPNDKKYIGITCKKPNARWEGGSGYNESHQPIMYNAIQKYGWENVQHKILYQNLTFEEASNIEKELIKKYKTNCRRYGNDYGYNMTDGGEGTTGHIVSAEGRRKMSEAKLGKTGELCPNSRPVVCDGVRYASLTEFRQKNNVKGAIYCWLNGTKGMPIEWYERGLHYEDSNMSKIRCQGQSWSNQIMYDGRIFNSQRELADYIGISPACLCKWKNKGLWEEKGIQRIK